MSENEAERGRETQKAFARRKKVNCGVLVQLTHKLQRPVALASG